MRVIGGKHRGAVLYEFKGQAIRPTSDRAKEAVFNILQFSVKGSKCLDLCCGTGSLGIEALSRGAAEVTFADNARESVELTKKNLAKTGERADVILSDALVFLGRCRKKFDIVFIDPPYADDVSVKAVELIVKNDLLTDNGVIVFERDKPFGGAAGASVFDLRKYGKAYISLIRKTKKCLFAGTFDPFTTGHAEVVKAALKKYDLLYVVIMKNDKKVPMFSLSDRMEMLKKIFYGNEKIIVDLWDGYLIDYMKNHGIIYNARGIRNAEDVAYEKIMEEYNTARYPEMKYDYITTECGISSTYVREAIAAGKSAEGLVPYAVSEYLRQIQNGKTEDK